MHFQSIWLLWCLSCWLHYGFCPFTGCAEELHTFVLLYCAILQSFVNFEIIFLYELWVTLIFTVFKHLKSTLFLVQRYFHCFYKCVEYVTNKSCHFQIYLQYKHVIP